MWPAGEGDHDLARHPHSWRWGHWNSVLLPCLQSSLSQGLTHTDPHHFCFAFVFNSNHHDFFVQGLERASRKIFRAHIHLSSLSDVYLNAYILAFCVELQAIPFYWNVNRCVNFKIKFCMWGKGFFCFYSMVFLVHPPSLSTPVLPQPFPSRGTAFFC